ncbi:MAG: anion permease [Candidatus Tectimicrobiota bacterium]|nr:MAG: anion permease [Candidatus Tectomicrobia bacterium]
MSLVVAVETLLIGGVTGLLAGLLGVGGGFLLIPLLSLSGTPIHTAIGTSLAFIACVSLAGSVQHLRQGSIDLLVALALALPAAVMASVGARLSGLLSPAVLHLLFGLLVLGVLAFFHFSPLPASAPPLPPATGPLYVIERRRRIAQVTYRYRVNLLNAVLSGMSTGLVSGFFGVGGGFLLVPLSVSVLHIPLQITAGTCLAVTVPPALVGAITHGLLGHVDLGLWLPLVLGGLAGSQLGARLTVRVRPLTLKRLFSAVLLLAALSMLARGLRA